MGTVILKLKPSNEPTLSDELRHWGIPGMKWGRRRYQNEDGSLTDEGKKRYRSQVRKAGENAYKDTYNDAYKKAIKRLGTGKDAITDPKILEAQAREEATRIATAAKNDARYKREFDLDSEVQKDLDATETVLKGTESAARTLSGVVKNTKIDVPRMDLSKMTDKEMRDAIARSRLEGEYDAMFNPERAKVNRGKERVAYALDTLSAIGSLAATGVGIALAIKQWKGR